MKIDFINKRKIMFAASVVCIIASIALLMSRGLAFGIDFTGGMVIELQTEQTADMKQLRTVLSDGIEGEVALQNFGSDRDVMIRIQVVDTKQATAIENKVKALLEKTIPGVIDYRKVDYVGPQISGELMYNGMLALTLAFAAIMLYVWFRFGWQFGLGAIIALIHDTILTLGFFSLLAIEFNMSSIAAILTIIGYSINDSVVIYDRIRENLRKYKKKPMIDLLNISINGTLSRTLLTAGTTIVALLALVLFGGQVVQGFSLAVLFGVIIGTYSSIYVATPILLNMVITRDGKTVATNSSSQG